MIPRRHPGSKKPQNTNNGTLLQTLAMLSPKKIAKKPWTKIKTKTRQIIRRHFSHLEDFNASRTASEGEKKENCESLAKNNKWGNSTPSITDFVIPKNILDLDSSVACNSELFSEFCMNVPDF